MKKENEFSMQRLSKKEMKKVIGGALPASVIYCDCNSNDDCTLPSKPTCYNGKAYNCKVRSLENFIGVCDA